MIFNDKGLTVRTSWGPSYCDLNKKEYNVMGTGCMRAKNFQKGIVTV